MKQIIITLLSAFAIMNSNAQTVVRNNYDAPVTEDVIQQDEDEHAYFISWGLSFYSFKGGENYGSTATFVNSNNIGFEFAYRMSFKSHGNLSIDVGPNFSFKLWKQSDTAIFLTPSIGGSLRVQDEFTELDKRNNPKYSTKIKFDIYANPRLILFYKRVFISAGYYMWAAEAKFEDPYLLHGFQAGLGINF